MTFRLYIYYCALCGAWTALLGWVLGRMNWVNQLTGGGEVLETGLKGMLLGLLVSLGLSLVDSVWNLSLRQAVQVILRVVVAVAVGMVGGLLGGLIGQYLYDLSGGRASAVAKYLLIFGWTVTGFLIGLSLGAFEVLSGFLRKEQSGAMRKAFNGVIGGTAGGLLGGGLYVMLGHIWGKLFADKESDPWSPSAIGFVILGLCIGLLIGLAQVILKEAWVKIGKRGGGAGRELILAKPETTIGRSEACDIGLFGDNTIERDHARIVLDGHRYYVIDSGTPAGTYVNDERIDGPALLSSGDAIRVGNSVLRFGERAKEATD